MKIRKQCHKNNCHKKPQAFRALPIIMDQAVSVKSLMQTYGRMDFANKSSSRTNFIKANLQNYQNNAKALRKQDICLLSPSSPKSFISHILRIFSPSTPPRNTLKRRTENNLRHTTNVQSPGSYVCCNKEFCHTCLEIIQCLLAIDLFSVKLSQLNK